MGGGKGRLKKASMGVNKKVETEEREVNEAKTRELLGRMEPQVGLIASMYWGGRFDP